jgi:hypothetical protein
MPLYHVHPNNMPVVWPIALPLLKKAKQDTINYYKANPTSNEMRYSTSNAIEYLDDLIELFQPQ